MKKSDVKSRYISQQKNFGSHHRMAVLLRNKPESVASRTDEQNSNTRQYPIAKEMEMECQKNLDTAASCETAGSNADIQPSHIMKKPRTITKRWKRQRPIVKWKPPDVPHASVTDETANLSTPTDKFQEIAYGN